ncbi:PucR family transcriptional regulator [Microbacterium sp. 179-B 1A2 NHS]|uniref:PucR family transcriptional regulator n=1 Tax=Microbacterium sp. 179-B 1A2 NHS TaxID=3142383 RepID=UPI0039A3F73D
MSGGGDIGTADPDVLRVADLLSWEHPRMELAGRAVGLDRAVRWALPTDLLDPAPYLRGGELVLTSGISMRDPTSQQRFVDAVSPTRPAAIGYALGVVPGPVPPALVATANARGIAVLSVPADVAFVEITQRIAVEQQRHDAEELAREATGSLLDMVRRGHASPIVLRDAVTTGLGRAASMWVVAARGRVIRPPGAAVVGTTSGMSIALVAAGITPEPPSELLGPDVGWSGPIELPGLPGALREAVAAARLAAKDRSARGPRDLATWEGLIERLTPEQLTPFRDRVLAPLRDYDARHRTTLVATLERLCHHDGSVQLAAEDLFVHVNTVRKRVDRIEALTGLSPLEARGRAALLVALAARDR